MRILLDPDDFGPDHTERLKRYLITVDEIVVGPSNFVKAEVLRNRETYPTLVDFLRQYGTKTGPVRVMDAMTATGWDPSTYDQQRGALAKRVRPPGGRLGEGAGPEVSEGYKLVAGAMMENVASSMLPKLPSGKRIPDDIMREIVDNVIAEKTADLALTGAATVPRNLAYDLLVAERIAALGTTSSTAPTKKGLEHSLLRYTVSRTIVSDAALRSLHFDELLEYREKARDSYAMWTDAIRTMQREINDLAPEEHTLSAVQQIVDTSRRRLVDHERAMIAARDILFSKLDRDILTAGGAVIAAGVATQSVAAVLSAGFAGLLSIVASSIPHFTQYKQNILKLRSENPFIYLIGLSERATAR